MKAAVATALQGNVQDVTVQEDWPAPVLDPKRDNDCLILRVLACALAPGDVRVLSGQTAFVQLPKGPPYVVGSDVSGVVVQVPQNPQRHAQHFSVGDYVVARFDEPQPQGGMAQYRKVLARLTAHCPSSIAPTAACGLPASAMAAKRLVSEHVRPGNRVLVIGGSGGVGSYVLQYAKLSETKGGGGASFVATVSTQVKQCQRLGADVVLDYQSPSPRWWQTPDFQQDSDKFDVVIDLVNGDNWTTGAQTGSAVKRQGTYVAVLTGVETDVTVRGWWDLIRITFEWLGRSLYARLHPKLPNWVVPDALKLEEGDLDSLLQDVVEGRIETVLDPASPFPFTTQGVRDALALQTSKHAHGKVVVQIANR